MAMMFVGSNWTLGNKKVALKPREPLNLLHISNRNGQENLWRAVALQVWNYFIELGPNPNHKACRECLPSSTQLYSF
jgi:hypothetical protein